MHLASRSLDIDEGYSTMTVKRMVMDRDRNPWNDHAARYSELIAERELENPAANPIVSRMLELLGLPSISLEARGRRP